MNSYQKCHKKKLTNSKLKKKFNRVHYHTLVFFVYGVVQLTIPLAPSFSILLIQMAILGLMDGILLCFIVPISFDVSKSSKLANHAAGLASILFI
jgi:predicted MFS family arabinose efflux permease